MVTKEVMDSLFAEEDRLKKELKPVQLAITALQAVCDHKNECTGHDHKDNWYKCKVCRLETHD